MTTDGISVVIPVYNSESSLRPLLQRLERVLRELGQDFEAILVNDGSSDGSWEVVQALCAELPWVSGIKMMRNFGQHNAVLCGTRAARFQWLVTMDDDLQHPPEEIPRLLAKLKEGHDVVYGTPQQLPHSWSRNVLSVLTKRAMGQATRVRNIRNISAFRAFKTELRRAFSAYQSPTVLFDVLLSWATVRFTTVPVRHEPRQFGVSNYTFWKLVNQALLVLTGFTTAPLRVASFVGFGFTLFGVVIFVYVMVTYVTSKTLPGFPFLASMIALFSGAQLFSLGIMGEYLARIFARSMERPTYVVEQHLNGPKDAGP
jgi:glycosyltransferase involved in cell wall biosynthesis